MSTPISIRVLFFGRLADLVEQPNLSINLPEQISAADLYDQLGETNTKLLSRDQDKSLKVAVNQRLVHWGTVLSSGDEVAFMPPVTGG